MTVTNRIYHGAYYEDLESGFTHWLWTLGYHASTVYGHRIHLRELLAYAYERGSELSVSLLKSFRDYLPSRPNERRGGGLALSTLEGKYNSLRLVLEYLKLVRGIELEMFLPKLSVVRGHRYALSESEIKRLYEVIDGGREERDRLRDRAIMAVFYGCGLRRGEGMALQLRDLLFSKKLLLVRKGKGGKQRYVPLTDRLIGDLKAYVYGGRYAPKCHASGYLFISKKRNGLSGVSYDRRLHRWAVAAGLALPLSLHVLRHSIATHLLGRGMKLELVSRFLGHSSLVSTQVYTHLLNVPGSSPSSSSHPSSCHG